MTETRQDTERSGRIEPIVVALRKWLDRIRGFPKILDLVLLTSVASGLALAWIWFGSSDLRWVRWLALPWLGLAAVPQLGLWFLSASIKELLALPERLTAIKSGVSEGSDRVLERLRRDEPSAKRGFLRTLREAYSLHGEIGKVVATRTILHRFTGPLALMIGPVAFVANCLIVVLAAVTLALSF